MARLRMLRRILCLLVLTVVARSATAQFRGEATYLLGIAATDVGEDEASGKLAYGFGAGASYRFSRERAFGLVVGAELAVTGFGIEIPGRAEKGAGVFDQSDLLFGQFVGIRFKPVIVGAYFEQRRIHRGTELGTFGFPVRGVGFTARARLSPDGRTEARFSYSFFYDGQFRLEGVDVEPSLDSGRSFRVTFSRRIGSRFGVSGTYSDIRLALQPVISILSFFDHRQRAFFAGAILYF